MMFNKDLIDLILPEKKTMTSRDNTEYREGDITNLMANKDYSKITGKCIQFSKVYNKCLKDFTEEDAHKEGFPTLKALQEYWNTNIGKWEDNQQIHVHEFKLIDYDSKLFEDPPCNQCGSCCVQLRKINDPPRKDIHRWVKDCRADILQYLFGWNENSLMFLITSETEDAEAYFWEGFNREMWYDYKKGLEIPICPFLSANSRKKHFECLIHGTKPAICKEYHCKPSNMNGIIRKPFDENLKEYKKLRRHYHSVKSAPNKLEKAHNKT